MPGIIFYSFVVLFLFFFLSVEDIDYPVAFKLDPNHVSTVSVMYFIRPYSQR